MNKSTYNQERAEAINQILHHYELNNMPFCSLVELKIELDKLDLNELNQCIDDCLNSLIRACSKPKKNYIYVEPVTGFKLN